MALFRRNQILSKSIPSNASRNNSVCDNVHHFSKKYGETNSLAQNSNQTVTRCFLMNNMWIICTPNSSSLCVQVPFQVEVRLTPKDNFSNKVDKSVVLRMITWFKFKSIELYKDVDLQSFFKIIGKLLVELANYCERRRIDMSIFLPSLTVTKAIF